MALTLYGLVLVAVLFVNAVAVLNEERFLARSMSRGDSLRLLF
jgi:hypothetical protein